jgi:hypothetical protein
MTRTSEPEPPSTRRAQLWARLADERGQTFTEYVMISGFATMLGLFVINRFQIPFKQRLLDIANYVLNNAADIPW